MTIDEVIKYCEEVAEYKEGVCKTMENEEGEFMDSGNTYYKYCKRPASEHRQLAEWLKELKKYEEGLEQIKELINDYKGHDMWDTANGMQLALECLEGE